MFSNVSIRTRLTIGFAITLLAIIITSGAGYVGTNLLSTNIHSLVHVQGTLLSNVQRSQTAINMMRRFEKDAFINIDDGKKVDEYKAKWEKAYQTFLTLNGLSQKIVSSQEYADAKKDAETLSKMQTRMGEYAIGFRETYLSIKETKIATTQEANKAIGKYKEATHQSETLIGEFSEKMDTDMQKIVAASEAQSALIQKSVVLLVAFVFPLVLFIAVVLTRSIVYPLNAIVEVSRRIGAGNVSEVTTLTVSKDEIGVLAEEIIKMQQSLKSIISNVSSSVVEVNESSIKLSDISKHVAHAANELMEQSASAAHSSEEMASTSSTIADNCQQAALGVSNASARVHEGSAVVGVTIDHMAKIALSVSKAAQTVEALGARSQQIDQIICTIKEIADQTNLLALNAAIEAARAGDTGRGFAVVADEVRTLAVRTTEATKEIGNMIKAVQQETSVAVTVMKGGIKEVAEGTQSAGHSREAFARIVAEIGSLTDQITGIAVAAEEQSTTTRHIAGNIASTTRIANDVSQNAVQSFKSVAVLGTLAKKLQDEVQHFTV